MTTDRLSLAIAALKRGDRAAANGMLGALLAENPRHEILTIDTYDTQGEDLEHWTDSGCNSLVAQSVEITP